MGPAVSGVGDWSLPATGMGMEEGRFGGSIPGNMGRGYPEPRGESIREMEILPVQAESRRWGRAICLLDPDSKRR